MSFCPNTVKAVKVVKAIKATKAIVAMAAGTSLLPPAVSWFAPAPVFLLYTVYCSTQSTTR